MRRFRRFFIYSMVCVISFLGVELFLRVTQRDNPFFSVNTMFEKPAWNIEKTTNLFGNYNTVDSINIYHPCIPVKKPYQTLFPVKKHSSGKRILCLGTSSTEGSFMTFGDRVYSEKLQAKLRQKEGHKQTEVINVGLSGSETFRLEIYFSQVLIKLKPDMLILYLGGNDHDDGAGPKYEFFYQKAKELIGEMDPNSLSQQLLLLSFNLRFPSSLILPIWNTLSKSYVVYGLFSLKNYIAKKIGISGKPWLERNRSTDYFYIAKRSFGKMIQTALDNQIDVVLVPEIYSDCGYAYKRYAKLMRQAADQYEKVFYVDIRNDFESQKQYNLFVDYIHFTEKGHALFSEIIYNRLVRFGLI